MSVSQAVMGPMHYQPLIKINFLVDRIWLMYNLNKTQLFEANICKNLFSLS